MKNLSWLIIVFVFLNCSKKISEPKYYQAILEKKDTAYLKLYLSEESFYGTYTVLYFDKTKDSGEVTGTYFGDTLKGKYRFISKNNIKEIEPIVFLKDKENLRLGVGKISSYMSIPFYKDGTLVFNDSLFLFKPQKMSEAIWLKKLNSK